jgi:hypothetical protein
LGEALIGGRWTCRLFQVEPRGEVVTDGGHPRKVGATAWKVTRELPAHLALGPNGMTVAALIERAGRVTVKEARSLVAAWNSPPEATVMAVARVAAARCRGRRWVLLAELLSLCNVAPAMFDVIEAAAEIASDDLCLYALHEGSREARDPKCPGAPCHLAAALDAFAAAVREEMERG